MKNCFVAGTKVKTINGWKSIEKIKKGDKVWSRNDKTGEMGYKKVLNTFVTHPVKLVHLRYRECRSTANNGTHTSPSSDSDKDQDEDEGSSDDDDDSHLIIGTANHPFWSIDRNEWTEMGELHVGERLLLDNGKEAQVSAFSIEDTKEGTRFTTYNFEVEDWHTYFVAPENADSDTSSVWVHNTSSNPCAAGYSELADIKKLLGEGPEVDFVYHTSRYRLGMNAKPKHHVFPQEYRPWFEEHGFLKGSELDIDNFTVHLDDALHQAIHGGGNWRLGRTSPDEYNIRVMTALLDAEDLLNGRLLTTTEIQEIVFDQMRYFDIPKDFVRYK